MFSCVFTSIDTGSMGSMEVLRRTHSYEMVSPENMKLSLFYLHRTKKSSFTSLKGWSLLVCRGTRVPGLRRVTRVTKSGRDTTVTSSLDIFCSQSPILERRHCIVGGLFFKEFLGTLRL